MHEISPERISFFNTIRYSSGPVAYWMSRDQRMADNWALLYAQQKAIEYGVPLLVCFTLVPDYLGATWRQYAFMLRGLRELADRLAAKSIPFILLSGDPVQTLPRWLDENDCGLLVADFNPLRPNRQWKEQVNREIRIPFHGVDAHNIIPCRTASPKQEYAARTIRPKIHRLLPKFLTEFPDLQKQPKAWSDTGAAPPWEQLRSTLRVDFSVDEISWLAPGERAAHNVLQEFLQHKLARYPSDRNDPSKGGVSQLSPYLHFGQISAQRIALAVQNAEAPTEAKEAFLEELIVRRELAENFCYYNPEYDSVAAFPTWAQDTLQAHRADRREYLYSLEPLENARTHDPAWNAAQIEMVKRGKMHGYMRMYWAKKVLEWTPAPAEALQTVIYLNDKYELDGRDPNGYTGAAWSIGGIHDRAWFERPIFGKVRYMNFNGLKSKFSIDAYIARVEKY